MRETSLPTKLIIFYNTMPKNYTLTSAMDRSTSDIFVKMRQKLNKFCALKPTIKGIIGCFIKDIQCLPFFKESEHIFCQDRVKGDKK